jgi:AcrR family transcriptional regulator
MSETVNDAVKPLRADAARNRARLLAVAYETFAAEGVSVPIDEIAKRAGVGPGTVYRHFPTKEALFAAVVSDRVRSIVDEGRSLLADEPGSALFEFIGGMVRASATDHGLADALVGYGIDFETAVPDAEATFTGLMADLLTAGQRAGTVRTDIGIVELKALLMVCKADADKCLGADVGRVAAVIIDGLRAR